jgi:intracellular sulfur oxidation DsrE/DsrF family protein
MASLAGVAALGRPAAAQDGSPAPDAAVPADFKVVLHVAQEQHWPYVRSNLANLTQDWPRARIRVVVDGTAVYSLQGENDLTTALASAAAAGVEFEVCPNALREHQIDPSAMPSYAVINLGGVVALVTAQREGFAYVKP